MPIADLWGEESIAYYINARSHNNPLGSLDYYLINILFSIINNEH